MSTLAGFSAVELQRSKLDEIAKLQYKKELEAWIKKYASMVGNNCKCSCCECRAQDGMKWASFGHVAFLKNALSIIAFRKFAFRLAGTYV